jgi:hypothetical protein
VSSKVGVGSGVESVWVAGGQERRGLHGIETVAIHLIERDQGRAPGPGTCVS